ncbi:MAG: S8 family peptidase [Candidatus Aquicultor sp.]
MHSKLRSVSIALLIVLIIPATAPVTATPNKQKVPLKLLSIEKWASADIAPGEMIVKLKASYSSKFLEKANKKMQAQSIAAANSDGAQLIKLPQAMSVDRALQEYRKLPCIEYAEPNYVRHVLDVPNDEYYSYQWAIPEVGVPAFWNSLPSASTEITVAVIDSGVDYDHPDLTGKIIKGYDFVNRDNDPMDDLGHGTFVAGLIAANANNDIGIAGIAPMAKILAVKAINDEGSCNDYDVAQALTYAVDHGAKVINMSFGGPGQSWTLKRALTYAHQQGCIMVSSAGNDSTDEPYYPASEGTVFAVSALDDNDELAVFSNYGPSIDIAAPGVDIVSTCYDGNEGSCYAIASGTSAAAPIVSGVVAMLASTHPNYTFSQLRRLILRSTRDLGEEGRDDYFGYGLIDAGKAVAKNFITVDASSKAISTSGAWEHSAASAAARLLAEKPPASLTLSFTGNSISWFTTTGTNGGSAGISIDGVHDTTVDLQRPHLALQESVFTKEWATTGRHTIKIDVIDGDVTLDGFDIGHGIVQDAPQPPQSPSNVKARKKGRTATVSWDPVKGRTIAGYNIYRAFGAPRNLRRYNGGMVKVAHFSDNYIKATGTYYYAITSVDTSGRESSRSAIVSVYMSGKSSRR